MTRVQEIEAAIEALPQPEFAELVKWLIEREQQRWDEQIDADSASGKLDWLFEEADKERSHGLLRNWPPRK